MPNMPHRDYLVNYADVVIQVTTFAARKLGLQLPQTVLKLDTYNIACVPIRISMRQITLFASLSREEIGFFQRFKASMAGLTVVFMVGTSQQPLKIFCRCAIVDIAPLKDRDSLGIIQAELKPCPPDLITLIGDYILLTDRLKAEFEEYKDKPIQVNADTARLMGFNNYATMNTDSGAIKLAVYGLTSNRVDFLTPQKTPDLPVNKKASIKLFFQKYQFTVDGIVTASSRMQTGVQKTSITIGFAPELIEIMEDYWFNARLQAKKAN